MNTTPTDDLQARWSSIKTPAAALQGTEIQPNCGVWLSIDSDGHRCVLLENDTTKAAKTILFETKGVSASVEDLAVAEKPVSSWIVVVCRDSRYWEPFLAFAESLNQELAGKKEDNVSIVLRVLRRWRWLWTVDPSGLTHEAAIGLIGELWFLLRWAGISKALSSWIGPEGHLHDFAGNGVAVEVKTSQSSGLQGPVHRISSLAQLAAPADGKLYLFSLIITPDRSAGNRLSKLVDIGLDALEHDPVQQDVFLEKLAKVGWARPVTKEHDFAFRIISERLFDVNVTFPALSQASFPNGIPPAVTAVGYDLDLSACLDWQLSVNPLESRTLLTGLTNAN